MRDRSARLLGSLLAVGILGVALGTPGLVAGLAIGAAWVALSAAYAIAGGVTVAWLAGGHATDPVAMAGVGLGLGAVAAIESAIRLGTVISLADTVAAAILLLGASWAGFVLRGLPGGILALAVVLAFVSYLVHRTDVLLTTTREEGPHGS